MAQNGQKRTAADIMADLLAQETAQERIARSRKPDTARMQGIRAGLTLQRIIRRKAQEARAAAVRFRLRQMAQDTGHQTAQDTDTGHQTAQEG